MPIKYCPIDAGNFGDDLNTLLWPRLFPDFHRLTAEFTVFGIGTLLDGHHGAVAKKIVLGSGLGEQACAERDGSWEFRWVRGPLPLHPTYSQWLKAYKSMRTKKDTLLAVPKWP
jgi:hypothetical protein